MTPSSLQIYPAIDLKGGKCVRLRQGRADDVTVYSDDPVGMAVRWAGQGAEWIHVVDLDGAFSGHPVHCDTVAAIAAAVPVPVQVGGGLRTDSDIERMLAAGARRVVLGTRACSDPGVLAGLVARFGERVAVGIDARNGRVQVRGWVETTETLATELAVRVDRLGVRVLVCTDTATDGMLQGPNVAGLDALCRAVRADVIASGGIASEDDVRRLQRLGLPNLRGAIVGKALYEGTVTVQGLREAASGR